MTREHWSHCVCVETAPADLVIWSDEFWHVAHITLVKFVTLGRVAAKRGSDFLFILVDLLKKI